MADMSWDTVNCWLNGGRMPIHNSRVLVNTCVVTTKQESEI
jgi:hypothetical protein